MPGTQLAPKLQTTSGARCRGTSLKLPAPAETLGFRMADRTVVVAASVAVAGAIAYYLYTQKRSSAKVTFSEDSLSDASTRRQKMQVETPKSLREPSTFAAAEPQTAVTANLADVRARVAAAGTPSSTLVAVSKTKPVELLREAYDAGQRDFGENYVQEVVDKAPQLPSDIRWHFIGHLQTNKVKELLKVPNLFAVHTVDTLKLAQELQKRAAALRPAETKLRIFVQVNTSGEESKSGCPPADSAALSVAVRDGCPALSLVGLMCIGKYSASEGGSDVDFECLGRCRAAAATALGLATPDALAMSMGMSHDFEAALAAGATHVRVGSTIFGARAPKPGGLRM